MAIFFIPLFDVTVALVFLILLSSLTTFVQFVSAKQKVHTLSATENAFQTYLNTYSKKYVDEVEVIERFKIFKSNVEYINQYNSQTTIGDNEVILGYGPFTDMTHKEFTNKYLMKREDVSPSDIVRRSSATQYGNPPSIDWDALGKVTPVKNQLACGSCWAFATTGMLESRYAIVTNTTGKETLLQLSEQQLLDCSKPYGNMACGGGNIRNSINYLSNNTTKHVLLSENAYEYIMTYENDLYAANGAPCRLFSFIEKDPLNVLPENVISGWHALKTENDIEYEVANNGPVAIAIDANATIFQHYKSGIINAPCGKAIDHGVLVVGYSNTNNGNSYWKVKNSWGASWGENGYFQLGKGINDKSGGECGLLLQSTAVTMTNVKCNDEAFCNNNGKATLVKGKCVCDKCTVDHRGGNQCQYECMVDKDCGDKKKPYCNNINGTCSKRPNIPFGCFYVNNISVQCGKGSDWPCRNSNVTNSLQESFKVLKENKMLKNLTYSCSSDDNLDSSWDDFFSSKNGLGSLNQLTSLTVDVMFNKNISLANALKGILEYNTNLRNLSINIGVDGMHDDDAIKMSSYLQKFGKNLKNLTLFMRLEDLGDNGNLTEIGTRAIGSALATLSNLEALYISFNECVDVLAGGIIAFVDELSIGTQNSKLKELRLNFEDASAAQTNTSLNNNIFDHVGKMFKMFAQHGQLELLSLDLAASDVNATGVENLANGIACLANQKSFHAIQPFYDGTSGLNGCGLMYDTSEKCFKANNNYPSLGSKCLPCV
jgi:C1A family cysteine protease